MPVYIHVCVFVCVREMGRGRNAEAVDGLSDMNQGGTCQAAPPHAGGGGAALGLRQQEESRPQVSPLRKGTRMYLLRGFMGFSAQGREA